MTLLKAVQPNRCPLHVFPATPAARGCALYMTRFIERDTSPPEFGVAVQSFVRANTRRQEVLHS
jgi:hypothetical protein